MWQQLLLTQQLNTPLAPVAEKVTYAIASTEQNVSLCFEVVLLACSLRDTSLLHHSYFSYHGLISGGSLGSFSPKQMVPEFDKVVFNEAVGVIHGPIKTQFGAHLILIESRDD